MPTPWIVEPFNLVEHVCMGLVPGGAFASVHALALERREEALDRRVVPAVALSAHATGDPPIGQFAMLPL